MACNTSLIGITKNCDPNLYNSKGMLKLYICPVEFVTGTTLSGNVTSTGGIVTAINMSGSAKFTEFVFPKLACNYTEEGEFEQLSESVQYTQTVTATFPRREKAKRQAFVTLTAGLRNLYAIGQDYNGLYWILGYVNGVNVSGLGGGSETAIYTLTLTGKEPYQAPEVLDTIISGIIA